MAFGTPLTWLLSFSIALVAGVGLGDAAAIGVVPALFCGTFYGGLIPLMGHLIRAERPPVEPTTVHGEAPADRTLRRAA
ncbi:MAG: hypothetical protein ACYDAD_10950 [Acidimicrobiales bacterium]